MCGLSQVSRAQVDRVIHLWVDPMYGSDDEAGGSPPVLPRNPHVLNPAAEQCNASGPPPLLPRQNTAPLDVVDVNPPSIQPFPGPLLHAPWPFKTITGAIDYITASGTRQLPITSVDGFVWRYAIIHLLPGMYAASLGAHPDNGLPRNGESFPIFLPPGVNIQGTSALNTILDLEDQGPAFVFGVIDNGMPIDGRDSFIDSVTIYNASSSSGGAYTNNPEQGSGIVLENQVSSHPTITNCFFVRNHIGVLVKADGDDVSIVHSGTTLMNNTFAFNWIGLWNGTNFSNAATDIVSAVSRLILVNNIFDFGDAFPSDTANHCDHSLAPTWRNYQFGASTCFEGVALEDLTVLSPAPGDYNAYAARGEGFATYNVAEDPNQAVPNRSYAGLPETRLPATVTDPPFPGINIRPFVREWATGSGPRRGILYVRDVLCRADTGLLGVPAYPAFDFSLLDLRLAPAVAPAGVLPVGGRVAPGDIANGGVLNPLVNAGWSGIPTPSTPLQMMNGQGLTRAPGELPLVADNGTWAHNSLNWDCEGWGNPRTHDHPLYGPQPPPQPRRDIGADELGELVVAGYRFGTTMFTSIQNDPSKYAGVGPADNRFLFYLGAPQSLGVNVPGSAIFRPDYRRYSHLQTASLPGLLAANYFPVASPTPTWYSIWNFAPSGGYYGAPVTEITPHLLPDVHPLWNGANQPTGTGSLPNWVWCQSSPQYNPVLFWQPTFGRINPPGTYYVMGQSYLWLDQTAFYGAAVISQFGAGLFGGLTAITAFDNWCLGFFQAGGPNKDTLTPTSGSGESDPLVAVRFSLEQGVATWSGTPFANTNLQSFLVVVE